MLTLAGKGLPDPPPNVESWGQTGMSESGGGQT
jgi:hypothetical protein